MLMTMPKMIMLVAYASPGIALIPELKARGVRGTCHCRLIKPAARGAAHREANRMTVTDLIIFLVIGAVAGWLAGQIMKGGGFGLVGDIIVGVIGSLIGGWLFGVFGIAVGGLIGSIIAAVVGAIILIAILRLIKRA